MTTLDMEIAVMEFLDIRRNIVVPNVYWGIPGINHECDIIKLTASGYATEVEIKISKNDLIKDRQKWHGHISRMIKYLYFAVPKELEEFAIDNIPERAGLLSVAKLHERVLTWTNTTINFRYEVVEVKKPKINKACLKWTDEQMNKLARLGAMRILGMKRKLLELSSPDLTNP